MKIGVLGPNGRMGKMIVAEIGSHAQASAMPITRNDNKDDAFKACDVIIDFTAVESLIDHAALAHQYGRALVIGTTGLGPAEYAAIETAAKRAPILQSGNMSLGINLLLSLVEQAAKKLGDGYDIEIFEAHHRHKVDAPSGTALMLGEAAAKGRNIKLKDAMIPARFGQTGQRIKGSIGFSVFRGGDVIGDHTVTFAGPSERIEIAHKASDRGLFAKGAVKAAIWLKDKPAGLYTMQDVLGL
jgi:4-hydroxy-tetrahydrodipicolinate reductase